MELITIKDKGKYIGSRPKGSRPGDTCPCPKHVARRAAKALKAQQDAEKLLAEQAKPVMSRTRAARRQTKETP